MKLLAKAIIGEIVRPQIIGLYGPNGGGKTTLASRFKDAIMADLEDGSGALTNVTRLPKSELPDFKTFLAFLEEVRSGNHKFKALVIDSLEALVTIIEAHVCTDHKVGSIEEIPYGKGFKFVSEKMEELMHTFQKIRDQKSMYVIIVAHSVTKQFTDPKTNQTFDRYVMRTNERISAIVRDLCDGVYFLNHKTVTEQNKMNPNKVKAYSNGTRVIHTQWSHAYDAKARYQLKPEIEFTLATIDDAVLELMPTAERDIAADVKELQVKAHAILKDAELLKKIDANIAEAGSNKQVLRDIKSRLSEVLQETV